MISNWQRWARPLNIKNDWLPSIKGPLRFHTSWWCAGWGEGDHSRAAPQRQPLLPALADRAPTLAAGTSVVVQKPATKDRKCESTKHRSVFTEEYLQSLPDRTGLEGTGPSCLASGCPYCFAGCQWVWGWGLAACLQWSGSWILDLASQLGGLRQISGESTVIDISVNYPWKRSVLQKEGASNTE